jgi:hypothetical protein
MNFQALPGGQDQDFPVLTGVCPKCGKMDFHMAVPGQFASWVNKQKSGK